MEQLKNLDWENIQLAIEGGKSVEELMKEEVAKKLKPKKKSTAKKKPKSHKANDPVSEVSEVEPLVSRAIHCYMRENESPGVVHNDAKTERTHNGPFVLVFAHFHKFGEPCVPNCKEKIVKE